MAELLAFPEAFSRLEGVLRVAAALIVKGRVNIEEVGTRVAVMDAKPLEDATGGGPTLMRVRVDLGQMDEFTLDRLQELFARKPGPCPVAFDLRSEDGTSAMLQAQQRVRPDAALLQAVREMCGPDAVEVGQ
jgi:hypothetical protein